MQEYINYSIEQIKKLCSIPSPTGFTKNAAKYVYDTLKDMGYNPVITVKGTVMVDIGGNGDRLVLASHIDTLGGMVRSIKSNGRLRPTTLGGLNWPTCDGENCTIHTRDGKVYTGVVMNSTPSSHVFGKDIKREEKDMEIIIDEDVESRDDAEKLGIQPGDFIAMDPRTVVTPSGVIKSRFLDDKASASVLIGIAKYVKEKEIKLSNKVTLMFTVYEEVGHGGSAGIPEDTVEMISVDMGCVGDDLGCTEKQVSICAKDSGGPYNYDVTTKLINTAKRLNLDYAIDVYPMYGSDVETTLRSGHEIRHGLIGPGVYASHNYERTHAKGIENTFRLIMGYISE